MISRCFFKQQGFGAGASCRMQMIITSVLWHHSHQPQSFIYVWHFIMWAQRIFACPQLVTCNTSKGKESLWLQKTWDFPNASTTKVTWLICLLSKSFSMGDMILPCKATDVMCVLLTLDQSCKRKKIWLHLFITLSYMSVPFSFLSGISQTYAFTNHHCQPHFSHHHCLALQWIFGYKTPCTSSNICKYVILWSQYSQCCLRHCVMSAL